MTSEACMDTAFTRFLDAAGCRSQRELAEMLGVRQTLVVDAKKRNVIPDEWLRRLRLARDVDPQWVLTGKGRKYIDNSGPWPLEPLPGGRDAALPGRERVEPPVGLLRGYSSRTLAEELLRRVTTRGVTPAPFHLRRP